MIVELTTEELQYFFETELDEIKGKQDFPKEIIKQFKTKVRILMGISALKDLLQFKSLNFEKLNRKCHRHRSGILAKISSTIRNRLGTYQNEKPNQTGKYHTRQKTNTYHAACFIALFGLMLI